MDNELSTSMMLTVELIVISAIIGIIMLFAGIGQQIQRSVLTDVTDVVSSAYGADITALQDHMEPVPVATVYLVIERNQDLIHSITGSIQGMPVTGKESLKGHFSRKVNVIVSETPYKTFIINIGG